MDASRIDLRVAGVSLEITMEVVSWPSLLATETFILEAELRAILQGIKLARRMGLVDLWMETDSTLVVHCISYGGGPWVIQSILTRIRHLLSFDQDTFFTFFERGTRSLTL
ncbi:Uncharacterized protein Adt_16025 [Abeliophyllum distichum]|uniref:RNase H type-1 domain-containing protein n=1 Tax=Abeliophyllum distichum TaxID=126358 RepID=A0ABD1U444_9LAMI